ncbi:putative Histidine kinase [Desulfamplus magnetovallimortis]|uniref:Sensory/regulatory protein RpfC n=1 Tax=Desulfamplus magnetovallimortis TaxID=1246637 RepID=A0A1W1HJ93_9BACT|nr:hybrid sensor histidine kinase/response regulator [Desulfamplus magnetovallimortis]SLM32571.1 putative Histidine kinase [Desulfamplus magnetovallimortis]
MNYSTKSLEHRLVIYVSIGLMTFSLLIGIFSYWYAYNQQLETNQNLQNQLVQTVRAQAEIAVFVSNDKIAEEILNGLSRSPVIKGVRIQSTDDSFSREVLNIFNEENGNIEGNGHIGENGHSGENGRIERNGYIEENAPSKENILNRDNSKIELDFTKGNVFPLFSPVDKEERIGSLIVVPDIKHIRDEATKASFVQAGIMLLQLLIATILIAWVSRRAITTPVARLAEAVMKIEPGKSSPLEISKEHIHDEIGMLSSSVNYLMSAVELALSESASARKAAEAATLAKSEFLANMSHEIRTPMNAIIGFSSLALGTSLNAKQKDYLEKISLSSRSLLGIINDILDFSKIEANKLEIENVEFKPNDIFNNIISMVSVKASEKGIELISNISPDVPDLLVGDPLRLGQVLINLANNAVKFTEKGYILVNATLVNKTPGSCFIDFSVSDTGIGLTSEQTVNLFKSFSQVDSSITRKFGGTGLGLAISKAIVEMMGGTISVKSRPGEGSTFSFRLSMGISRNSEVTKKVFPIPNNLEGLNILIVDDNPMALDVLKEQLDSLHFRTTAVESGQKALNILQKASSPYDLVIMDWNMPGMDGIETSKRIKEELQLESIPLIIMLTAFAREDIMQQAEKVGINAFLMKPVNQSLLYDSIMQVFGNEKLMPKCLNSTKNTCEDSYNSCKEIRGAKILLVEDNYINQQVATEILKNAGLVVEVACNGVEAIEAIEKKHYDLVLMDIQMPVMGGYEATFRIRQNKRFNKLPIVAMTAHAMSGSRQMCIDAGMNDYVTKPIDNNHLFSVLVKWIPKIDNSLLQDTMPEDILKQEQDIDNALLKEISDTDPNSEINDDGNSEKTDVFYIPEYMKEIPGVDLKQAMKRLNGNISLFCDLIFDFVKSSDSAIEQTRGFLDKNDLESAHHIIHTLKGSAGNLSALKIHKAAEALDSALINNAGQYEELLSRLDNHIKSLSRHVSEWEKEKRTDNVEKNEPVNIEDIEKTIRELAIFLGRNETAALTVFENFRMMVDDSEFEQTLKDMENHINNFDFESALPLLQDIARQLKIQLTE